MPVFENGKDFEIHNSTFLDVGDSNHNYYGTKQTVFHILEGQVAAGAFHNSGERFDPPKCHEGTRVAVLNTIWEWLTNKEVGAPRVMWLYGPAGAGKSAIAQTLAEKTHNKCILAASFFFSRTSSGRNDATRLVATIAYQVAQYIPDARSHIQKALEDDPMIFSKSLETQFHELVTKPLLAVVPSHFASLPPQPVLMIIDGLDECTGGDIQSTIIRCFVSALTRHSLPLHILISSRPELAIRDSFAHPDRRGSYVSLVLGDDFQADSDITLFLRESFAVIRETHILKSYIPKEWPSDDDIKVLVRKSSGQFIFASTVVRYVKSPRHRPMNRLADILGIGSRQDAAPFAELDALYMHILQSAHETQRTNIHRVLGFLLCSESIQGMELSEIEDLLNLPSGDLCLALADCHSIIYIPSSPEEDPQDGYSFWPSLHFHHASISDFLIDPARSQLFFVDQVMVHAEITRFCMKGISSPLLGVRLYSSDYLPYHCQRAHMDKALFEELLSLNLLSLLRIYSCDVEQSPCWTQYFPCTRQISWVREQTRLGLFDVPISLVNRHLRTLDHHMKEQINAFRWPDRLPELFALAYELRPHRNLAGLFGTLDVWEFTGHILGLDIRHAYGAAPDTCEFLLAASFATLRTESAEQLYLDFLYDRERAGRYHINQTIYAQVALRCIIYICEEPHENIARKRFKTGHNPKACLLGREALPSILSSAAPLGELADRLRSTSVSHCVGLDVARAEYLQRYDIWKEQDHPVQSEQDLVVVRRPQKIPQSLSRLKPPLIQRRMLGETERKSNLPKAPRQFPSRILQPPY
ncbi:hypothetical protein BDZ94DRAFT_1191910 [Collybia nuda]|uniref:NACHT domain-containing protein n=1 Tax=Collybia nuda TaxID=64659 RepID=A0A9P5Y681_9AGAR|nr:hypothetical protein BDZ94DRAFT_1191910 [Collybia nuda]